MDPGAILDREYGAERRCHGLFCGLWFYSDRIFMDVFQAASPPEIKECIASLAGNSRVEIVFDRTLIHPFGEHEVGGACAPIVPVAAEDQVFPIGGKHGKGIENGFCGDLLYAGTVLVDHVDLEIITAAAFVVGAEQDLFAGGVVKRSPIGLAQVCDLFQV